MCFLRHLGADAADEMLTAMLPFRDHIIGVGLDSTEIGFPNPLFADVFARAAAEGLHLVAHAGEEGDAQAWSRRSTACTSSGSITGSGRWTIPRWLPACATIKPR